MNSSDKITHIVHAYCFRDGVVHLGTRVPKGALKLGSGNGDEFITRVQARARLSYDNSSYLVPGVPEARDDDEAVDACVRFRSYIREVQQLGHEPLLAVLTPLDKRRTRCVRS